MGHGIESTACSTAFRTTLVRPLVWPLAGLRKRERVLLGPKKGKGVVAFEKGKGVVPNILI